MLLAVECYEHICSHFLNFAQWATKGKHGTPVLVARRDLKLFVQGPGCRDFVPAARALARASNSQAKAPKFEKPKVGRVKQERVTKRQKLDPPMRGSARPEFEAEFDLVFKDACNSCDKQREAAEEEEALFGD